jgi:hypothetical protein
MPLEGRTLLIIVIWLVDGFIAQDSLKMNFQNVKIVYQNTALLS